VKRTKGERALPNKQATAKRNVPVAGVVNRNRLSTDADNAVQHISIQQAVKEEPDDSSNIKNMEDNDENDVPSCNGGSKKKEGPEANAKEKVGLTATAPSLGPAQGSRQCSGADKAEPLEVPVSPWALLLPPMFMAIRTHESESIADKWRQ
jgi:hypothetical protein